MNVEPSFVTVYLLGKKCRVPADLTIMQALEYAGFRLVRGCGCRSGVCGACAVLYRVGDEKIHSALACQTKVQDDMHVGRIDSFPDGKKAYDMREIADEANVVAQIYPEIEKCIHCNACTNSCPQHIPVLKYVIQAQKGQYAACARTSFACVACHICSSRCPVHICHSEIAVLARRIVAMEADKGDTNLQERVQAVHRGDYDAPLSELMALDEDALAKRYDERTIE